MKLNSLVISVIIVLLSSCAGKPQNSSGVIPVEGKPGPPSIISETIPPSQTNLPSPTSTITPTQMLSETPTITETEIVSLKPPTRSITATMRPTPALDLFFPEKIRPGVAPVTYIDDMCRYLDNRWGEGKSGPGTIVAPIMFHSVAKPGWDANNPADITREYFEYFMDYAYELGFTTITMDELVGFLYSNEPIPELSMILILDDRRPGVTELFMPYLEEYDWTLTLGWITTETTRDSVWEVMMALNESGRLDIQSHGHNHIYIQEITPFEVMVEEVFKPVQIIEDRFGQTPVSIVWPGGNFNKTSIELAQEAGFKLGFTAYSRGPLMYNWVPLGEQEAAADNPLYVLPRFWSSGADVALIEAVEISQAAKAAAYAVQEEELETYALFCRPSESK